MGVSLCLGCFLGAKCIAFLRAVVTPDKVSMRCEGLISASSLRIQFVVAGKARGRRVLVAAGHVASSGRKESDHRCSAHSLIFIQPRTPPPHSQDGSSPYR